MGDATIVTTIEANLGYWKIEIDDSGRDKKNFISHNWLYRFIHMPFGLKNAPGTFQRVIDVILSQAKWKYALIFIEDILVFSKSVKDNMTHLRKVLNLLKEEGLTLKLKKCKLFYEEIDCLVHVIRPGSLRIDERTS